MRVKCVSSGTTTAPPPMPTRPPSNPPAAPANSVGSRRGCSAEGGVALLQNGLDILVAASLVWLRSTDEAWCM
eukprot:6185349-Pleurochrysis_carterae.AAC.5